MKRSLVPLLLLAFAPAVIAQREVRVLRPTRADLAEVISLVGTVEPLFEVAVVPRVTGYLETLAVDVGDTVTRGQVLATISAPELAADLAAAQAMQAQAAAAVKVAQAGVASAEALAVEQQAQAAAAETHIALREREVELQRAAHGLAERELERIVRLHEGGIASMEELEAKQGQVEAARVKLVTAEAARAEAQADHQVAQAGAAGRAAAVLAAKARVDAAVAAVATAEARVARVEASRAFTRLVCPLEQAVVTARHLHPGAHVSADMGVVLVLMDVSKVRVVLSAPERDAARVAPGKAVTVAFQAVGVAPVTASITRVSGALEPSSRTRRLEVELDNADGALLPGMFVQGHVSVREATGALTLPGGAIRVSEQGVFVWVVRAGKLARVPVTLGLDDGERAEVSAGLTGDEQVVVGSGSGLREGLEVKIRAADEGGAQ